MVQYIDKDVLVAEINRVLNSYDPNEITSGRYALVDLRNFLDTLEVKEVDLEKYIQDHIKECLDVKFPTTDVELIKKDVAYTAKKFFELGLKAQKGEEV